MKRHLLLPALSLVVAAAAPSGSAGAQEIVPFVGAGLARGTGDLSNDTNNGWLVYGGIDVPLTVAPIAIGVTASYAEIPYAGGFSEKTQVTSVWGEISHLLLDPASMVRPYVRGGGGLQVHRYDPGSIATSSITDVRAGFTAGAGVNIMMGSVDGVVGARFATGTDGGFLGLHAGLALPLGR